MSIHKPLYPVFASHKAATCFNCEAVLTGEPRLEDFAPGGGQYSNVCIGGCGMRTWYDLRPTQVARLIYAEDKMDFA